MKQTAGPSSSGPSRPCSPTARSVRSSRLLVLCLSACLCPVAAAPLAAQNLLGPATTTKSEKPDGTVRWEVSVEPESVAPGGEISVVAKYDVPPKWYIYAPDHDPKDGPGLPMELVVESKSVTPIGEPTFPEPKIKTDPILRAVYRILEGKGSITQRFRVSADAEPGELALEVSLKGQRCDPSVCVPVDHTATVEVTVSGGTAAKTVPGGTDRKNLLVGGDQSVLGGDSVRGGEPVLGGKSPLGGGPAPAGGASRSHARWELSLESKEVDRGGRVTVLARYRIDPGWHIYAPDQGGSSIPTTVGTTSEHLKPVGSPTFPEPKTSMLPGLDEEQRWLEGEGTIRQSFVVDVDAPTGPLSFPVTVHYMTCTVERCDPDEKYTAELTVEVSSRPAVKSDVDDAAEPSTTEPAAESSTPVAGDDDLASQPIWLFILAMIGGGLFALAMPCTYPMIPITISYFTKQAEARHGAVLPLALAYGAGIIVIFNVIGIAFAGVIQSFAFHPVTNLVFCVAFVVFALSLFGLYEIRLPSSFNAVVGKVSGLGGYLGVFLLGTVLVISSFTCTAPVMGGLLILAVSDGGGGGADLARVSLGMTVFGATMAVPFVLLSLFPAKVRTLPSSGDWLHVLKVSLGYLELAAAVKFFSNVDLRLQWNVLPRELFLMLWAGIFCIGGLYILNLFRLDGDSSASIGPKRMLAGLCTVLLGLYFFWGALGYRLDWISSALAPAYSAERVLGDGASAKRGPEWTIVKDDIEAALERARKEGKPVLVNFTGHT